MLIKGLLILDHHNSRLNVLGAMAVEDK